jgi:hypothetical protein
VSGHGGRVSHVGDGDGRGHASDSHGRVSVSGRVTSVVPVVATVGGSGGALAAV